MNHNEFMRLDEVALAAFELTPQLVLDYSYYSIDSAFILLGICSYGHTTNMARYELADLNVREQILGQTIKNFVPRGMRTFAQRGQVPISNDGERVLRAAIRMADQKRADKVSTAQIVLAMLADSNCQAYKVLQHMRVNLALLKQKLEPFNKTGRELEAERPQGQRRLGGGEYAMAGAVSNENGVDLKSVEKFIRNLNDLAIEGKLDPVSSREGEIERVIQILLRRTKNNPILLGEPGVGKTAIAEGLAQRIVFGLVPDDLKDCTIIAVDMASTIAGAKYRGEFEERIKALLDLVKKDKRVIIFIDEAHTMVGAGGSGGGPDASNMLKGALSRGQMRCIAATTLDEYRQHFEKDPALERRFQPVTIVEPSVESTIEILKSLSIRYQIHHRVKYSKEALIAAVKLSDRYINDRFLPDKAIDLIDEAGSRVNMRNSGKVVYLQEGKVPSKETRKKLLLELEEAIREQNYSRAENLKQELGDTDSDAIVQVDDIAQVVESWTGIPVKRLTQAQNKLLLGMEDSIHGMLIGQDDAVKAVSKAIRRSRSGVSDPEKPIASFVFVGPTGVGKSELAKSLAKYLFDSEEHMIRIDMSEYMERHSVSKLVGAPPGFVGYEEGGKLTDAVRRRPYSVILFDEIEKAHPDVFNLLLQVLDDGRLTDAKGRTVDFKNTVIILTSNLGTDGKSGTRLGFEFGSDQEQSAYEEDVRKATEAMRSYFRPEFLNRLDEVIVFRKPIQSELVKVARILLKDLEEKLKDRGIKFDITTEAILYLAREGYSPSHGARELRRVLQRRLEDELSEMILRGELKEGATVSVSVTEAEDAKDKTLKFEALSAEFEVDEALLSK